MESYNETVYASTETYTLLNSPRPEILFISACLLLIVIAKAFLHYISAKLPLRAVLLIAGAIAGHAAKGNQEFAAYITISSLDPNYFLTIFIPVFIFFGVFKINQAVFCKNKWQCMVLAIPSILINTAVVGSIMKTSVFSDWRWITVFMYGLVCSPVDSQEVTKFLYESPATKYMKSFLEGESFFGDVFSIYLMKCFLYRQIECFPYKESVNLGWQWIVGGVIYGYIIGNIVSFIVIRSSLILTAISIILSAIYLTVFIAVSLLNISGDISIAVMSMVIAKNQFKIEPKVRKGISQFWNVLSFIGSSLMLIVASCATVKYTIYLVEIADIVTVLITLLVIITSRVLVVLMFSPLLSRMNGGFTMRQAGVVILSFGRSTISVALSALLIHHGTKDGKAPIIGVHVLLLLMISTSVVGGISPYILQYLRLREPPLSKKNHVTNCLKRLEKSRDRAIAVLKMQAHMTDVNWSLIENGTSVEHPYNVTIEECDEAEDDDFCLAFINTYCPRCQNSFAREPREEVLLVMRREAKYRILRIKRISYRRQYQDGLLSLESLMALLHMIDEVELSPDLQLKTDWIESIWKPKSSTMNLRRRLISVLMQDDPEPMWPMRSCRDSCYMIATSTTFNLFMYCAIILNSMLVVSDITMPDYGNQAVNFSFQLGHVLFYFLLFVELIIKIAGLGFDGYLNSKWNQVEFIVFVMATFDEFLLVLGLLFMVQSDELLVSSSWLRSLRLVRLLKLGKVLAPKLVMTIDSHMDGRMLAAFEIGKGFVAGEDEVLTILPRIIDDRTICMEMQKEIEHDRNEARKQMVSLQKNRSWLATSVRTRHTLKHALLNMKRTMLEMRNEGWLEKSEFKRLLLMIENKSHEMARSSKYTRHTSAKMLLRSIYWLTGDDDSLSYLYHRSRPTFLGPGQTVLHPGQTCPSVHIVMNGVLATFIDDGNETSLVPGDCVGLIEFLTGKNVEYSTITLTQVQLCTFPGEHLKSCMLATGSTSNGLESRMWCYAAQHIAVDLIRQRPGFKDRTCHEVQMMLERGFVPRLETFKVFEVTDIVEHIILINGEIMDQTTKEIFNSPFYIPRYLALPNINEAYSQSMYPKLLILPAEDADEYEIQEREDGITHVVSLTACRCLRHRATSALGMHSSISIPPRRKLTGFRRPLVRQTPREFPLNIRISRNEHPETNSAELIEIENQEAGAPVETTEMQIDGEDIALTALLFKEKS